MSTNKSKTKSQSTTKNTKKQETNSDFSAEQSNGNGTSNHVSLTPPQTEQTNLKKTKPEQKGTNNSNNNSSSTADDDETTNTTKTKTNKTKKTKAKEKEKETDISNNNKEVPENKIEKEESSSSSSSSQTVTPWVATCSKAFDYAKLLDHFGLKGVNDALLQRFEKVTGKKPHPWLGNRQIFFAHQDLDRVLDYYEQKKPIYLYTGRGPSNDMHLGHMIPFMFTKWLQDALQCPLVIQMSDQEKVYFKKDLTKEMSQKYLEENVKDIIACGFDSKKTFIFSQYEYGGQMYGVMADLMGIVNINQLKKIYDFQDESSLGQFFWPVAQIAPAFSESFPDIFNKQKDVLCLVPMAVDQTPYFRTSRDYADRLGYPKPAMICSKFLPSLAGENAKMSSTGDTASQTIYLSDDSKTIASKVNKHAFSGGKSTLEEHRAEGGDITVDMSFRYLSFFLEDDKELAQIADSYTSGVLLSGDLKKKAIDIISTFLRLHQQRRAKITPEILKEFMSLQKFSSSPSSPK